LTIVSLISSEICGIEHSDALIEISLILFLCHRALASLLDDASAIAIGRLKVTAYFGVDIVGVIVIEHLMIRVHSIIILLLLFAIERLSVDSSRILLLRSVTNVTHRVNSSDRCVALLLHLKSSRVLVQSFSKSLADKSLNLLRVILDLAVVIKVRVESLVLLVLIELQADHSERENQRLNEHHIELLSP